MTDAPGGWDLLKLFSTSLAVGLLVGIERERNAAAKAGLRTFALTALLGTLTALLAQLTGAPWLLAAGLLLVGLTLVVAHAREPDPAQDPGTTTVVAIALTYGFGALIWHGRAELAVPLSIVTTSLLYFKAELRGVTEHITRRDLASILQFGVLSMIVLPLLPDRGYGPYEALNPHRIWLMVVLISGLSLSGYIALRLAGPRHGAALVGLFGGLVSSTATTLAYSRRCGEAPATAPMAALVVLLASAVVPLRIALLVLVTAPEILPSAVWVLAAGALPGVATALWLWRRGGGGDSVQVPEVANPTELRASISFGVMYGAVVLLSTWFSQTVGSSGVYGLALISGLTDVDAITLSSLQLQTAGQLTRTQAIVAVTLALIANLALKVILCRVLGGNALLRRAGPGLAAMAAALALALLLQG